VWLASSMSIYGEGCTRDARMGGVWARAQDRGTAWKQLTIADWEVFAMKRAAAPRRCRTPEDKAPAIGVGLALFKFRSGEGCALISGTAAYGIPAIALRFLSNHLWGPYQGALDTYTGRAQANLASEFSTGVLPLIFEGTDIGSPRRRFFS